MSNNKKHQIRFTVSWFTALIFEYPFLLSLFQLDLQYIENNFISVLALHFFSALILLFSFPKEKGWFYHSRKWPQVYFFMTLFLPVFGLIFALLFNYFSSAQNEIDKENLFNDEDIFNIPNLTDLNVKASLKPKNAYEGLNFVPLTDILKSKESLYKRSAIDMLAKLGTNEAIETLLKERSSDSPEVRFYVYSALTKIKTNFEEMLHALKLELEKNPNQINTHIEIGKFYYRIHQSNLVDLVTSQSYLELAIFHLNKAVESNSEDTSFYEILSEIYMKNKNWKRLEDISLKMKSLNILTEEKYEQKIASYSLQQRNDEMTFSSLCKLSTHITDKKWMPVLHWWGIYS